MLPASFAVARQQPHPAPERERVRLQQKSISEFGKQYNDVEILDPVVRAQLYGRAMEFVPSVNTASPDPAPKPKKARTSKPREKKVKQPEECDVKVIFIVGTTGEWNAKEDYVVVQLSIAPTAEFVKRGNKEEEGKARYIKLTDREKQLAINTFDSLRSQGWGVNEAIRHLNTLGHPFTNVALSSIQTWQKKLGVTTVPLTSASGRPPIIAPEHREAIMKEVRNTSLCLCAIAQLACNNKVS
jgi:hypothetical protein